MVGGRVALLFLFSRGQVQRRIGPACKSLAALPNTQALGLSEPNLSTVMLLLLPSTRLHAVLQQYIKPPPVPPFPLQGYISASIVEYQHFTTFEHHSGKPQLYAYDQ